MMLAACTVIPTQHMFSQPRCQHIQRSTSLRAFHIPKVKSRAFSRRAVAIKAVAGSGLSPELRSALEKFVQENKIVLFIKGTKQFPQCGFSNTVVQIFNQLNVPYETVNVLDNELIRNGMKEYSQWPTFPQIYVDGEFFGGCDITLEAFQSGELAETVERVMAE